MARKSSRKLSLDSLLNGWPYDPQGISVRLTEGDDGREILQMRIELGVLQLETVGRPDGSRPEGFETYLDYLLSRTLPEGDDLVMSEQQCNEADREFVQYYHRRVCWLALRQFARAVEDADHTLGLMDFCRDHSPDEQWTISHEQYRPFVLFHRTQALALSLLDEGGPEAAVQAINDGLVKMRSLFKEYEAEDHFDEDELVKRLVESREALRQQHDVGRTLQERLEDAVAAEQYELAAQLRDELARRKSPHR
ncbi:MAG: UvrB/UvrC motif-containing protein [Pirellulales bacterium]